MMDNAGELKKLTCCDARKICFINLSSSSSSVVFCSVPWLKPHLLFSFYHQNFHFAIRTRHAMLAYLQNMAFHNDSKWASQFRQHGITAAAHSIHHLYLNKQSSSQFEKNNNWCEFGAQRNGSSMRHWRKPKKYNCDSVHDVKIEEGYDSVVQQERSGVHQCNIFIISNTLLARQLLL